VIVVSDASPISYLQQIGRLDLLIRLYGRILIPPAVEKELLAAAKLHAGIDWSLLEVVAPKDPKMVEQLREELDSGESEAIAIAVEMRADLLLIDEAAGREAAKRYRLRRTGTLGVLLDAKQAGLIASASGEFARLIDTGFWVRREVQDEFLRLAGEG
jgi:uncharacterized protein